LQTRIQLHTHRLISPFYLFFILSLLATASLAIAIFLGNSQVNAYDLRHALFGNTHSLPHEILFRLRIPHALTAFVTGGLLALAGALMQVLVRNPLADPYILGISGGAGLATLLLMLLGFSGIWLTGGAWMGSLLSIVLIFLLTHKQPAGRPQQLLLTGIALASGFSACTSLILLTSPDIILRSMFFWLVGDLSETELPFFASIVLLLGLLFSLTIAKELNLLVRGEKAAEALGVNTTQLQWKLYLLSSLLTATAVTLAGCIGFIGLIVPHLFRLLFSYDHRYLLPGCVLLGGSLLTLADVLARTLFFPQTMPVGIIMVLLGIPVFLFLLQKNSL
jgi:iron complex transport system permease protein